MEAILDFDRTDYYVKTSDPNAFEYARSGVYCRCAIEYGWVERAILSTRNSSFMLYTGVPINYAERIIRFPERAHRDSDPAWRRNTLVVGPQAYAILGESYGFEPPVTLEEKDGRYTAYAMDTRDLFDR
jgi:hypothetical protein